MKLYVIRHGQVNYNVREQINGINNSVLNTEGLLQAREASKIVKDLDIDIVICSPILRAKQTCEIVNVNNIHVEYDNRLKERDSKSMQYKHVSSIDKNIWYDKTKDIIYSDAEGFGSMLKRISDFLNDIKEKYPKKNILIVTHGDVCKAIYTCLNNKSTNLTANDIANVHHNNCEIKMYEL